LALTHHVTYDVQVQPVGRWHGLSGPKVNTLLWTMWLQHNLGRRLKEL